MYVSIAGVPRVVLQQQCSCAYGCIQTAYSITRATWRKNYPREARWRSKTWDRTTCFAGTAAERRITRTALEQGREMREARKKRERQKDTCICVRNNYPAYYRPLLPRKSLTSCWRPEKVRICCGSGKKRRKNFSLRWTEYIYKAYRANKFYIKERYIFRKKICRHISLSFSLFQIILKLS